LCKENESGKIKKLGIPIGVDARLIVGKEVWEMLPKDPVMLLSFVNLKLRDFYSSLDMLCEEMDVDKAEIIEKLADIDYHYHPEKNQFV